MYVLCLHVGLKRGGSPTKFFLPTTSNQPFVPFIPPPFLLTFRSHSLMHLKNIAYTMFYASFNRLLWAVHTRNTFVYARTKTVRADTHVKKKNMHAFISRIYLPSSLSLSHSLSLSLSLSHQSVRRYVYYVKRLLWHYVIHYGLRLRYILLYIATLTLSANADKVNMVSSPGISDSNKSINRSLDKNSLLFKNSEAQKSRYKFDKICSEFIIYYSTRTHTYIYIYIRDERPGKYCWISACHDSLRAHPRWPIMLSQRVRLVALGTSSIEPEY